MSAAPAPASPRERPSAPRRGIRWVIGAAVVLAIVVAALVWYRMDLPRRLVERALERSLRADVNLGSFTIEGLQRFVLRDVTVRRMEGQPHLDVLRIATLEVTGSLPEIHRGRFETVRAIGAEARLQPRPAASRPAATGEAVSAVMARVDLVESRVVLGKGPERADGEPVVELSGTLTGFGIDLAGSLELAAKNLPLDAIGALWLGADRAKATPGGVLEDLHGSARIDEGGRTIVSSLRSRRLVLSGAGGAVVLPDPSLEIRVHQEAEGEPVAIDVRPSVALAASSEIALQLDPDTGAIRAVKAEARALDLRPVLSVAALLPPALLIEGKADVVVEGDGSAFDYELESRHLRLELAQRTLRLVAVGSAALAGRITLDGEVPTASVRGTFDVASMEGADPESRFPQDLVPLRGEIDGEIAVGGEILGFNGRASLASAALGRLEARGAARTTLAARWSWKDAALERLAGVASALGWALPDSIEVSGTAHAEGTLTGSSSEPRVAGTIALSSLAMRGKTGSWSLRDGGARGHFLWRGRDGPVELSSVTARGALRVEPLEEVAVTLDASGSVDPFSGALDVGQATLDAPGLFRAHAKGRSEAGDLHVDGVDLGRMQGFLRPVVGDLMPGFALEGRVEAQARLTLGPDGAWRATGTAKVEKNGFGSDDGARVLEGLDSTWDLVLEGSLRDPRARVGVRGTARVSGFQVLWGGFFADGSKLTSSLTVEGRLLAAGSSSRSLEGHAVWSFPDGPRLEVLGSKAEGGPLVWSVAAEARGLERMIDRYLRVPLGDSIPFVRNLDAAGSLRAEAAGAFSDRARLVRGRLAIDQLRLAGAGSPAGVAGLDLDLPFDLEWGSPDASGRRPLRGDERSGSLSFARIDMLGLELPATATALRVRADDVELERGLRIKVLGGVLGVEQLAFVDLLDASRHLQSGIVLSSLQLEEASPAFGLPPLEGTLDAYFPRARLSMDTLEVEGGGDILVFGGTVKVGDISGADILTRYPKLAFSASFKDIDLAQVTGVLDFGEITGLVEGHVRNCDLFRGVPVAFEAEVRTVVRPGVPRTVNVKAIENLTILGTGTTPNLFDRGIQKFLDRYTYDRIGVRMTLDSDVFLLTGLERRGNQELFVKGRLPFPINVVNAQPGTPISFQDMVERLRSLDLSQAAVHD